MRRGLAVFAGIIALALPSVALAKPTLTVARAKAAIRAADPYLTIQGCQRQSRQSVRCAYTEPAVYLGIEAEGPAMWESWALARQTRRGITVTGPTI